jgi:hypothetical protein
MRRSKLKHPLAVLRTTLGIPQKTMAVICDCNESLIKRMEGGRVSLSIGMIRRIVAHTGVNFRWLVLGDPKKPILDVFGHPYQKELYAVLCDDYSGQRRVSRHDPNLIKYATYSALGRFLLLILGAAEMRRTIGLLTLLHAFLDELDCVQGFRPSQRLASELSKSILNDTMRAKPNPLRYVATRKAIPELGLPGGTTFNAAAYGEAESRFNKGLELVAVLNLFGGEVDTLIAEQRRDARLARNDEDDRLPQLLTSTAMLLPLSSTTRNGAPRRDYRRLAKEAAAKEETLAIAEKLSAAGTVSAKIVEQLKQANVPSDIVECFERLRNLRSRKITIFKPRKMPSTAPPADLTPAAFAEAQRRLLWGELVDCLENSCMNNRDERVSCLHRIRDLGLEEKLRRVLAGDSL